MPVLFTNNASSTLASSITNVQTSITVAAGQGARFPSPSGTNVFYATLVDVSNNIEIVKCTSRSTDTLTIVRAQEGTTARAYASGSVIELRVTAAGLTSKMDKEGGTFTGPIAVPASTASAAGINVPPGTAPTVPVNGDCWVTTTGVFFRVNGSTYEMGQRSLPRNLQSGTYTLAATDAAGYVYSQNAGAQVINVPLNATTAIARDSVILIVNNGSAAISLTPAGGVTLKLAGSTGTGTRTIAANGMCTALKVDTDVWFVSGPGVS